MSPNLGKITFTETELADLRSEAMAYIERHAWTKKRFAEECGVPEGTFGPWLSGSYAGNNDGPASKVHRFLEAKREQAQLAAAIPATAPFQNTPTSKRVLAVLDHAQVFEDLVVIGLRPGLGKTASIRQFQATRPRTWVATMAPSTRGVPNALVEVLAAMGDHDAKGTPQALSRRVQAKATPGSVLVIDEAQHLSQQAVDEFRSIHDRTGCGLAFSGDESVFSLFDGVRRQAFAQFHSRIGMRLRQSRPLVGDAQMIAAAYDVTAPAMVKLCAEIANKPGALRGLTKTLRLAKRAAALADEPLTTTLIREAWAQRSDDIAVA